MEKMKDIIEAADRQLWADDSKDILTFSPAKIIRSGRIRLRKQMATEILSGPDTVYINIRSLDPGKAVCLSRENFELAEQIESFLSRSGFSHKYEFGPVTRFENKQGFSVEWGRLARFEKYDKIRLAKQGESSRLNKFETFTYLNRIREGLGDILRRHGITPDERMSRIDIFRDYITRGLQKIIRKGTLPLKKATEKLDGSFMKQRRYYERQDNSRALSGIKFWNTSTCLVAYSKSLESLRKSDSYKSFYDAINLGSKEEVIRLELRQTSTFALNALYPVFLDAIKEKSEEKMLLKLEQIEVKAFNSFLDTHPFVARNGERDAFIELLLRRDVKETGYADVENLMQKFTTLTYRELFNTPAQREDVIKALLRTFYRLNMDPKKITKGDLAELQSLFDMKRRRKFLNEGEVLDAQQQSALLISDPRDHDAIVEHFDKARDNLKYQLVG